MTVDVCITARLHCPTASSSKEDSATPAQRCSVADVKTRRRTQWQSQRMLSAKGRAQTFIAQWDGRFERKKAKMHIEERGRRPHPP